jgi:uncharacterized membrane protein (DUF2068 family)
MHHAGVRVVAVVEAAKGLLVLAVGVSLFSLVHRDVEALAEHIVRVFHLDPASGTPSVFIDLAAHLTSGRLQLLALGALLYSTVRLVQAWGLWRFARWAEWLTVVAGGMYIPVELYELWKSVTWPKLVLLAVNLAVVAYLARVLWESRRSLSAGARRPSG